MADLPRVQCSTFPCTWTLKISSHFTIWPVCSIVEPVVTDIPREYVGLPARPYRSGTIHPVVCVHADRRHFVTIVPV